MGEYEDRYPDAYGHGEATEPDTAERRHGHAGLPRQTREAAPPGAPGMQPDPSGAPAPPRHRPLRSAVGRPANEIRDDVYEQLRANPFIDASEIAVAVNDGDVTLDGTINSLIAVSLARALAENTAGVRRVEMHLKVRPTPRERRLVRADEPSET